MDPRPIGCIKYVDSDEAYITFYQKGKTAVFSDQLFERTYEQHGINIPASKINTTYPEIKDRVYKRIYSDDGELFQRAFLEFEFRRLNTDHKFKYEKIK